MLPSVSVGCLGALLGMPGPLEPLKSLNYGILKKPKNYS